MQISTDKLPIHLYFSTVGSTDQSDFHRNWIVVPGEVAQCIVHQQMGVSNKKCSVANSQISAKLNYSIRFGKLWKTLWENDWPLSV